MNAEPIRYSRGRNKLDAYPENRTAESFDAFVEAFLSDQSPQKGLVYVTSAMRANGDGRPHRGKAEAENRSFLAFDFDRIESAEVCMRIRLWFAAEHKGFGYFTASSTPEAPRMRIILAADREMTPQELERVCLAIDRDLTAAIGPLFALDKSVYQASQPIFTPTWGAESFHFHGDPVDVDKVLLTAPEAGRQSSSSRERATEAETRDPVMAELDRRGMLLRRLEPGKVAVTCPFEAEHTTTTSDTATVYLQPKFNGVLFGRIHCLHDHCRGREQPDYLQALELDPRVVWAKQSAKPEPERTSNDATNEADAQEGDHPSAEKVRFRFATVEELMSEPAKPWRVLRVIPGRGLVVLWGASGSGKTFVALDLAAAIARNQRWAGRRTKRGTVAYIAAEGHIQTRIAAYLAHNGLDRIDGLRILNSPVNLLDPLADTPDLIRSLLALRAITGDIALVIVDTLNRVMTGGDENGSEDMGRVVANARKIEDALGCAVLFVHHSGKDESKGSRGHSSLKAATDAEISVRRDGDIRTVTAEKVRDGEDGDVLLTFRLRVVDLGSEQDIDPDAEPDERRTSCVIESTTAAAPEQPSNVRLSETDQIALRVFKVMCGEDGAGRTAASSIHPAGRPRVEINAWRDRFRSARGIDKADAKDQEASRKAFQRAIDKLVQLRIVGVHEARAWLW